MLRNYLVAALVAGGLIGSGHAQDEGGIEERLNAVQRRIDERANRRDDEALARVQTATMARTPIHRSSSHRSYTFSILDIIPPFFRPSSDLTWELFGISIERRCAISNQNGYSFITTSGDITTLRSDSMVFDLDSRAVYDKKSKKFLGTRVGSGSVVVGYWAQRYDISDLPGFELAERVPSARSVCLSASFAGMGDLVGLGALAEVHSDIQEVYGPRALDKRVLVGPGRFLVDIYSGSFGTSRRAAPHSSVGDQRVLEDVALEIAPSDRATSRSDVVNFPSSFGRGYRFQEWRTGLRKPGAAANRPVPTQPTFESDLRKFNTSYHDKIQKEMKPYLIRLRNGEDCYSEADAVRLKLEKEYMTGLKEFVVRYDGGR